VLRQQGGPFKYPTPRPLEESEIPGVVEAFATAAKNAREAGFDGVEVRVPCLSRHLPRHLLKGCLACPAVVLHIYVYYTCGFVCSLVPCTVARIVRATLCCRSTAPMVTFWISFGRTRPTSAQMGTEAAWRTRAGETGVGP
jgi:hypothetical protein